jgi:hypothetical protein
MWAYAKLVHCMGVSNRSMFTKGFVRCGENVYEMESVFVTESWSISKQERVHGDGDAQTRRAVHIYDVIH